MAKKNTPDQNQPTNGTHKRAATPETVYPRLQRAVDGATRAIIDGSTSYARAARSAAKVGIPREHVEGGAAAIEEALRDMRAVIERSYAEPTAKGAIKNSRYDFSKTTT